jgi:hypothetical protein
LLHSCTKFAKLQQKNSGESQCGVGKLSTRAIRRKCGLAMFKEKKKKKSV